MEKSEIYARLNSAYFSEEHHEKQTLDRLQDLLGGLRLFIDVGASLGQYTSFVARHATGSKIVAIEADPIRYEELQRNCARWSLESGNAIEARFAAASDTVGTVDFFVTDSNVSGGLAVHEVEHQPVSWRQITVPAVTLDSLCGDATPDLVKVDVEGGELRVLKGAVKLMERRRTRFLVEVHPWGDLTQSALPSTVFKFMTDHGYRGVGFFGQTLFLPDTDPYLGHFVRNAGFRVMRFLRNRLLGRPRGRKG